MTQIMDLIDLLPNLSNLLVETFVDNKSDSKAAINTLLPLMKKVKLNGNINTIF